MCKGVKNNKFEMLKLLLNNCKIVERNNETKNYLLRLCHHFTILRNNELINFMLTSKIELYRTVMTNILHNRKN
jgi:hypothetical protein